MKILLSIFLFYFSLSASANILFVFYDAGETNALKPVLEKMVKRNIPFKVMVMGTSRTLFTNESYVLDIKKNCNTDSYVSREKWPREKKLSLKDLNSIQKCYKPQLVVTGSVSKAQYQIARQWKMRGVPVVSYVDAFAKIDKKSIVQTFKKVSNYIVVPTEVTKESLGGGEHILVLGQPSLEKWAQTNIPPAKLLELKKALGEKGKRVLFVGSYGEDYKKLFQDFLQASAKTDFNISVSLHPKSDGKLEQGGIDSFNSKIHILDKKIPTAQWAVASDIIICYRSTVCFQALNIPKTVVFYELESSLYSNFLIEQSVARKITASTFSTIFDEMSSFHKPLFVSNSSEKISDFLEHYVKVANRNK